MIRKIVFFAVIGALLTALTGNLAAQDRHRGRRAETARKVSTARTRKTVSRSRPAADKVRRVQKSAAHRRGRIVRTLPRRHTVAKVGKVRYHYHDGVYYRPVKGGGYVVVGAPIGAVVRALPPGYLVLTIGGHTYYRAGCAFYRKMNSRFVVVSPPVGVFLDMLPYGYETVYIGDEPLYYYEGVFYRYHPGRFGYVVIDPPLGAFITYLPEGYQMIGYGSRRYYFWDGIFFRFDIGRNLYVVVGAPVGISVPRLPGGYAYVNVGNVRYARYRGLHYRPVMRSGRRFWMVVDL